MIANPRSVRTVIALIVALGLFGAAPAAAQLTPMPIPLAQWEDNTGAVLNGGGICVFAAGTSTLATTYTTAGGTVANANPVPLNGAGRPTSGGVFLTPGVSYKFVLKDATVTTCVPDTGVTLWSVDNVQAVPGSASTVDATGTAGESLAANDLVYLSDGSGGKNQGQWYKADADLVYAGALPVLGLAPLAIASGSTGSIVLQGRVTGLTGLSAGVDYFVSSTAGALTSTAPGYARMVGRAESATVLVLVPNPRTTPITPRVPCGRVTLTTATPVTGSDVTAATTVYYTPYGGCNSVTTFDGALWAQRTFTEVSIAVPAVANQMYDVFAFDSAGTFTLELTATSRTDTTGLSLQNGVYVKTGVTTRLYLGSFRTTAVAGQTEDSFAKRLVWNHYNRVPRELRKLEATNTWPYNLAAWRQANGSTANQVEFVIGVAEVAANFEVVGFSDNDGGGSHFAVGIGLDTVAAPTTGNTGMKMYSVATGTVTPVWARLRVFPAVGYHYAAWLEYSITTTGITTWYGDNNTPTLTQAGISGSVMG